MSAREFYTSIQYMSARECVSAREFYTSIQYIHVCIRMCVCALCLHIPMTVILWWTLCITIHIYRTYIHACTHTHIHTYMQRSAIFTGATAETSGITGYRWNIRDNGTKYPEPRTNPGHRDREIHGNRDTGTSGHRDTGMRFIRAFVLGTSSMLRRAPGFGHLLPGSRLRASSSGLLR